MSKLSYLIALGDSPLTDLRSLGTSALFHILVVLLASLTVLKVALPSARSRPKALDAEVDPVDNRADRPARRAKVVEVAGEMGGIGSIPFLPTADGVQSRAAGRDSIGDSILAEISPETLSEPA